MYSWCEGEKDINHVKLETNGKGGWTKVSSEVNVTSLEFVEESNLLYVYFDNWDVKKNDLIVDDPLFLLGVQKLTGIKKLHYAEFNAQEDDAVVFEY